MNGLSTRVSKVCDSMWWLGLPISKHHNEELFCRAFWACVLATTTVFVIDWDLNQTLWWSFYMVLVLVTVLLFARQFVAIGGVTHCVWLLICQTLLFKTVKNICIAWWIAHVIMPTIFHLFPAFTGKWWFCFWSISTFRYLERFLELMSCSCSWSDATISMVCWISLLVTVLAWRWFFE